MQQWRCQAQLGQARDQTGQLGQARDQTGLWPESSSRPSMASRRQSSPPPAPTGQPPMEASEQSTPQEPPPEPTAPSCAAAVAIHGHWTSNLRPQPIACPAVPEDPKMDRTDDLIQIQATVCQVTCGILTFQHIAAVQAQWLPSCDVWRQCRRRTIQAMCILRDGQSLISNIFEQRQPSTTLQPIKPTWRNCSSSRTPLRSWLNTIQDQIMGEAQQAHRQLMKMIWTMQEQSNPQPWAQAWAERPVQPPPRPVQPTAQPQPVPVKPPPAARPPMHQSSSSSMSSALVNAPFSAQMGADPWFKAREQNQQNHQWAASNQWELPAYSLEEKAEVTTQMSLLAF